MFSSFYCCIITEFLLLNVNISSAQAIASLPARVIMPSASPDAIIITPQPQSTSISQLSSYSLLQRPGTICAPAVVNHKNPIFIVDGHLISSRKAYSLTANNIETIVVLKGPDAIAAYGNRGKHGVLLITMKKRNCRQ
jgi:hypothetical protein